MHKGHHGSPDLTDDHLPERDLGNVWSVLKPLGNTLKGNKTKLKAKVKMLQEKRIVHEAKKI
jgi:hypothetical protein